jgi:hypothetical protein
MKNTFVCEFIAFIVLVIFVPLPPYKEYVDPCFSIAKGLLITVFYLPIPICISLCADFLERPLSRVDRVARRPRNARARAATVLN